MVSIHERTLGPRLRLGVLVAAALLLSACAATADGSPVTVERVASAHYAPTQFVNVLHAPPTKAYTVIARVRAVDPTGAATRGQLIAELESAATRLGANALIIDSAATTPSTSVQFNPAGGLQQSAPLAGAIAVSGTAIRMKNAAP